MNRLKAVGLCLVLLWGWCIPGSVWGAAGDVSWEKQFTFLPTYDTISVNYTALSTSSYIVSGSARHSDGSLGSVGFIKAYDVATGTIKWEKTLTLGPSNNGFGPVVINGDIALVRGSYNNASGNPPVVTLSKSFIRAYHVDTGEQLWEVVRDFEATAIPNPPAGLPMTLTGNNRVFTFFFTIKPDSTPDFSTIFVKAYQVRNVVLQTMLLLD